MCSKIVFGLKLSVLLDLKNRCAMVAVGGVKGVRDAGQVWPGTRRTSQAAAAAPRARKAPKRAAERFRGLGKLQNTPLNVSEASEAPKHAAEGFRDLGRRQGRRWHVAHVGAYRFDAGEGGEHFKFISDLPLHLCPRFL